MLDTPLSGFFWPWYLRTKNTTYENTSSPLSIPWYLSTVYEIWKKQKTIHGCERQIKSKMNGSHHMLSFLGLQDVSLAGLTDFGLDT